MSEVNQAAQAEPTTATQTAEELAAAKSALKGAIVARFNNLVDVKEMKFGFKSDKETGFKRPTVELHVPVPSVEGIVDILENADTRPKELELLLEVLADAVAAQVRSIVNDDEKITQDTFPLDKATWAFIANMPKAERRGGGIAKETWDEFAADYLAVMPGATGKTAEQVGLAAKLLTARFAPVKTQKPVIEKLQSQIGIYVNTSSKAEEFSEVIEFLTKKAETLLTATDEKLLEAL